MKAIVWSNVGCSYCEQAKKLLKSKEIGENVGKILIKKGGLRILKL